MRRQQKSAEEKNRFDTDLIKAVADIETVAGTLGLETRHQGKNVSILCPEHNDRHFGSCFLTKNGYKCYACGAHGDMIHLVMRVLDCTFEDACIYIADIYGHTEDFAITAERLPRRILDDASLKLIGLGPATDYVNASKGVVIDPDEIELAPNQRLKWIPTRSQCCPEYYIIQELVTTSPLRDLLAENEDSYNWLIAQKAMEAAANYRTMIDMAKDPMRYYDEKQPELFLKACHCEEVADAVGLVCWEAEMLKNIRKCDDIRIEHSNGSTLSTSTSAVPRRQSVFGKIKGSGISF